MKEEIEYILIGRATNQLLGEMGSISILVKWFFPFNLSC